MQMLVSTVVIVTHLDFSPSSSDRGSGTDTHIPRPLLPPSKSQPSISTSTPTTAKTITAKQPARSRVRNTAAKRRKPRVERQPECIGFPNSGLGLHRKLSTCIGNVRRSEMSFSCAVCSAMVVVERHVQVRGPLSQLGWERLGLGLV